MSSLRLTVFWTLVKVTFLFQTAESTVFLCNPGRTCDGNPDSQGLACDTESEDDRFCCSWSSSEQCYRKCCTSCTHGWSGASGACYNWSWWATFLIVVGSIFGLFVVSSLITACMEVIQIHHLRRRQAATRPNGVDGRHATENTAAEGAQRTTEATAGAPQPVVPTPPPYTEFEETELEEGGENEERRRDIPQTTTRASYTKPQGLPLCPRCFIVNVVEGPGLTRCHNCASIFAWDGIQASLNFTQ